MAQLGGLSSDAFSSPATGLGSILRDQKVMSGVRSNRASVILGIMRPPVKQSVSVSSSPVESFLHDMDVGADDADELKEEDVWGVEDSTDGTGPGADFGKLRLKSEDDASKQRADWAVEELGLGTGSPIKTSEVLVSSRRREWGHGIVESFVNNNQMARGPLFKTPETTPLSGRGRIPRRPSATRMIPLSGAASKEYSKRHAEGQSAPVQVPIWSKKGYSGMDDANENLNDEEDERLPPHELLAKEYASSQRNTFSVCEGLGRTLKGRDMSRVRNAVWRQIGFAD